MSKEELDRLFFISFCIENFKQYIHTEGSVVMDVFDRYGVTGYLNDNYEVLHTQNARWLMEDISDYIQSKKEQEAAV